jgi:hypothetical protein
MSDSTPMPNTWVLWYHDPNDNNYSESSYTNIASLSTPAEFWSVIDAISKDAWESGMFFFMRDVSFILLKFGIQQPILQIVSYLRLQ